MINNAVALGVVIGLGLAIAAVIVLTSIVLYIRLKDWWRFRKIPNARSKK